MSRAKPWQTDAGKGHKDIMETSSGNYKCPHCGKVATKEDRLEKTECE